MSNTETRADDAEAYHDVMDPAPSSVEGWSGEKLYLEVAPLPPSTPPSLPSLPSLVETCAGLEDEASEPNEYR